MLKNDRLLTCFAKENKLSTVHIIANFEVLKHQSSTALFCFTILVRLADALGMWTPDASRRLLPCTESRNPQFQLPEKVAPKLQP